MMSSSSVGGLAGRDSPDCAEKRPPRGDVAMYAFKVSRQPSDRRFTNETAPMLDKNPRSKLLPSRGSTHNLCTNVVNNHKGFWVQQLQLFNFSGCMR